MHVLNMNSCFSTMRCDERNADEDRRRLHHVGLEVREGVSSVPRASLKYPQVPAEKGSF